MKKVIVLILFVMFEIVICHAKTTNICDYTDASISEVASGVWKISFGTPEKFTPEKFRDEPIQIEGFKTLPKAAKLPFKLTEIRCRIKKGRTIVYVPCNNSDEQIYGFGLDSGAFEQKGMRKFLSVSDSNFGRSGISHGPVPYYVSTKGYGIYVDTARIPFVHVANLMPSDGNISAKKPTGTGTLKTSVEQLYEGQKVVGRTEVVFDIPGAKGIDVYVFAGPSLKTAVQRYNLFSGGGSLPPMWGLGLKYRTYTSGDSNSVMNVAKSIRQLNIPCDMLGLEPGWQSHAYSCSFLWSNERFNKPQVLIDNLNDMGFRVNLWEHAYIHPTSPMFASLKDKSGDYLVWGGLVVDFADSRASKIFADYHEDMFVSKGISGFKADECDRQFIGEVMPFNYPYCSTFPSGIEGDQMTQLYGYLYQHSINSVFKKRNLRTWGDVRATTAIASPLPFNLYSDTYGFDEYLRQLVNSSFAGLLWSPEVRQADSLNELLNRIALSSFGHQMCLNPWWIPNPIWSQYNKSKNERGELLPVDEQTQNAEKIAAIVNQRMSLIPYFYSAFYRYYLEGVPPIRAIVMDFVKDKRTWTIDDAFMFGDSMLVAPLHNTDLSRKVYLPKGADWIDMHTGDKYHGGTVVTKDLVAGQTPIFIKNNSIIPLAQPVQYVADDTVFKITAKIYGDQPRSCILYEDDGISYNFKNGKFNKLQLKWSSAGGNVIKSGNFDRQRYQIISWQKVKSFRTEGS